MKAQSAVFEQVLLFGIAVAIFVAAFGIFQIYEANYESASLMDHTKAVRDMVYNHLVELTVTDKLNASLTIRIPKQMSGEYYRILLNNTELRVTSVKTGIAAVSSVSSITTADGGLYTFSGETISSKGEIIFYKRGYNIIID